MVHCKFCDKDVKNITAHNKTKTHLKKKKAFKKPLSKNQRTKALLKRKVGEAGVAEMILSMKSGLDKLPSQKVIEVIKKVKQALDNKMYAVVYKGDRPLKKPRRMTYVEAIETVFANFDSFQKRSMIPIDNDFQIFPYVSLPVGIRKMIIDDWETVEVYTKRAYKNSTFTIYA